MGGDAVVLYREYVDALGDVTLTDDIFVNYPPPEYYRWGWARTNHDVSNQDSLLNDVFSTLEFLNMAGGAYTVNMKNKFGRYSFSQITQSSDLSFDVSQAETHTVDWQWPTFAQNQNGQWNPTGDAVNVTQFRLASMNQAGNLITLHTEAYFFDKWWKMPFNDSDGVDLLTNQRDYHYIEHNGEKVYFKEDNPTGYEYALRGTTMEAFMVRPEVREQLAANTSKIYNHVTVTVSVAKTDYPYIGADTTRPLDRKHVLNKGFIGAYLDATTGKISHLPAANTSWVNDPSDPMLRANPTIIYNNTDMIAAQYLDGLDYSGELSGAHPPVRQIVFEKTFTALEATLNGMARIHSKFLMPLDETIVMEENEYFMIMLTVNEPNAQVLEQFAEHPWITYGMVWRTQASPADVRFNQWPCMKFFGTNDGQQPSGREYGAGDFSTQKWYGVQEYVAWSELYGMGHAHGWYITNQASILDYQFVALSAPPPLIVTATAPQSTFSVNVTSSWNIPIDRVYMNIGVTQEHVLSKDFKRRALMAYSASSSTEPMMKGTTTDWKYSVGGSVLRESYHPDNLLNSQQWQNGAFQYGREVYKYTTNVPALQSGNYYYSVTVEDMAGGVTNSEIRSFSVTD